ncbi:GIY-YIG nuclease family protein [Mesohalobacter halotolerans]|uniref:GIY-YIG nuclease family protein n=1 Tax=Mesohalobacter halotolerans TaxID=1883405 RepID=UPI001BB1030C|nr:GIY-YIG nuclease family protein [Psychroflexus sp.]
MVKLSGITYYTYLLESLYDGRFYIGQTQDLQNRLAYHNKGYSNYTKKFRPWKIIWPKAFKTRSEAFSFE